MSLPLISRGKTAGAHIAFYVCIPRTSEKPRTTKAVVRACFSGIPPRAGSSTQNSFVIEALFRVLFRKYISTLAGAPPAIRLHIHRSHLADQ